MIGVLLTFILSINSFSQTNAIQESSDIIIYGDVRVYIDSAEQVTTHGSLTGMDGAMIENQGSLVFDINDNYQSLYNYSSQNFFTGQGNYYFNGNADFYTGGDFSTAFYNLWINKTEGSNLFLENSLSVSNQLNLDAGHVVTDTSFVIVSNTDSAALVVSNFSDRSNTSYIEGNLRRYILSGSGYHFPVGLSNRYFPLAIASNTLSGVDYLDVAFKDDNMIPLTGDIDYQDALYHYHALNNTGSWMVKGNNSPTSGTMDIDAYIFDFMEYGEFETNMFGLVYNKDPKGYNDEWSLQGEFIGAGLPSRQAGSEVTKLIGTNKMGYYTVAVADVTKLINFIAPGADRYTIFYIPGLEPEPGKDEAYFQDTELIVYNAMGREIFQAKPYNNDLDMGEFRDGTYYYIFKFTRNGKPGVIQSFIDVKRVY